ncbi:MAG TPA: AGE family epimerase/isomerase, partial [Micavibrio sp.]
MNFGTLTAVEHLAARLQIRWLAKWHEAFYDPATGGFHERLGHSFKPRSNGARRLLTQCRQLSIYSHALTEGCNAVRRDALKKSFDFILKAYRIPETGGWRYSLSDSGEPLDETSDLYSLSFIIFSFSHYFRAARDERAKEFAFETLDFIERRFRMEGLPGLAEALDGNLAVTPKIRRQNPHMHLLEACLFAHETWGGQKFLRMADEITDLFYEFFYSQSENRLCEFFLDDLTPDPEKGNRVEPGHYFEWVWLLKKHARIRQDPARHDGACRALLGWANGYGWDETYGGIYDVLDPSGRVLADTKRIWPFTEALKANALMMDAEGIDRPWIKARIGRMINVFRTQYMEERGFWVEWLNRDLSPATDYMPGTTPYHVYFGIIETRDILRSRGGTVSLRARP